MIGLPLATHIEPLYGHVFSLGGGISSEAFNGLVGVFYIARIGHLNSPNDSSLRLRRRGGFESRFKSESESESENKKKPHREPELSMGRLSVIGWGISSINDYDLTFKPQRYSIRIAAKSMKVLPVLDSVTTTGTTETRCHCLSSVRNLN